MYVTPALVSFPRWWFINSGWSAFSGLDRQLSEKYTVRALAVLAIIGTNLVLRPFPVSVTVGGFCNVFLSDEELAELQADFPTVWQEYIERLSEYMASTGRTYKSHAATIRRWIANDLRKAAPVSRDRDYSVKDGDTV